jgi:hypothetical protein
MGYRSDVCYVVKFFSNDQPEKAFADYLAFQDWVKNKHTLSKEMPDRSTPKDVMTTVQHSYKDENGHIRWSREDCVMTFETDDVKWYDGYIDVEWHKALLEKVKKYETGNYRSVRIGEDYSDTEVDEYAETYFEMWDLIEVHRSYTVNSDIQFDEEEKADE